METLKTVLLVLEVIASIALIVVVLLQSGKEAGLSGAIAGNSETYLSKNKKASLDKMLSSATKWVALAWILLTLALNIV
ncbi:MAG: preprotein translocase subunit SecG [Faecousia sp.]